jgi:hypothetical protein
MTDDFGGNVAALGRQSEKKEGSSFLKKRSKKRLLRRWRQQPLSPVAYFALITRNLPV